MALTKIPQPGTVIEYLQDSEPQIAWVTEEQNGKLRLLLPNRRETNLPAARVLPWQGPSYPPAKSREEIIRILQEHKEKRLALAGSLDMQELWELTQGETAAESAEFFAELSGLEPSPDLTAGCAHAMLGLKSHFRFQPPVFEIYTAETVAEKQAAEQARKEREAMTAGGAEWFRALWDVRDHPEKLQAACPGDPVRGRLEAMLRKRIADPETKEDEHLWNQVVKTLPDDPYLPLILAETWGIIPRHYNYWLDRADYEAGTEWERQFEKETAALVRACAEDSEQAALSATSFISIDSASTRDIDDAFAIRRIPGGWEIHVALACPASFWHFGGDLDKKVFSRASSLYLPDGVYHMMPERLGTDGFSLLSGEKRPAMVFSCLCSEDGGISSPVLSREWVSLEQNLDYDSCEAVLEGADGGGLPKYEEASRFAASLREGLAFAETRLKARLAAGAVIIDRQEPEYALAGEGADLKVKLVPPHQTPKSQLIVSEMMIIANEAIADLCAGKGIPLLFRTQDLAIPKEYSGLWTEPQDIARVVKVLTAAVMETSPRPHAGLGLKAYATVTSPLRRYGDLVNEAQVLSWLASGTPRWTKQELDQLLLRLNIHSGAAAQVQRFRPRYWRLVYLRQEAAKFGDKCGFPAVVADENDMFVSVTLTDTQLTLRAKRNIFGGKVMLGQRVMVRLGKINPMRGDIAVLGAEEA